jgi:hypothetical protein
VKRFNDRNDNALYDRAGRPFALDAIAEAEIIQHFTVARKNKNASFSSKTGDLFMKKANETAERRGNHGKVNKTGRLDKNTEAKSKKRLGITKRRPQTGTDARMRSCFDFRMTYTMWVMLAAFTKLLWRQCIWNIDATQFKISENFADDTVDIIKDEEDDSPISTNSAGKEIGIAIKWMQMGSAHGESAPLVLMVALKDMKEDQFYVAEIPGLSSTTDVGRVGYLVFCKSRAGNKDFFRWFIEHIVIPTVTKSRESHEAKVILNDF